MEPTNVPSEPGGSLRELLSKAEKLHQQNRHADAEPILREAVALADSRGQSDSALAAQACDGLAYVLFHQDEYAEAETLFRRALSLRRDSLGEQHADLATSYNNLGLLLRMQSRQAEAEVFLRAAHELFSLRLGPRHEKSLRALTNLALNSMDQGLPSLAESQLRKVLESRLVPDEPSWTDVARCQYRIANVLCDQGRFADAEPLYREAISTWERAAGGDSHEAASGRYALARCLRTLGKLGEAEALLRDALKIVLKVFGEEHCNHATGLVELGLILEGRGQAAGAEAALGRSVEIRRRVFGLDNLYTVESLFSLGAVLQGRGKSLEAEPLLRAASNGFEMARVRASFEGLERAPLAAWRSPFPRLAACLARNGKPVEAWQALERSFARGLLDELHARRERVLDREDANRLQELMRGYARLSAFEESQRDEREASRTRLVEFQARLAAKYGVAAGEIFTLERIQSRLPPDSALVAWVDVPGPPPDAGLGDEHWAFLLPASGEPRCVRLPGGGPGGAWTPADDELLREARRSLSRPPHDGSSSELRRLLERVRGLRLSAVELALSAAKSSQPITSLVVIPAGAMAGIPIEALSDQFSVTYAPSGTLFAWLREQGSALRGAAPRGKVLALGDPAPGPEGELEAGLGRLPGARVEVEAIARSAGAGRNVKSSCAVLLGSDASEQALDLLREEGRLGSYDYLHFATHAVVDDAAPLNSAIVLARDRLPDRLQGVLAGGPVYDGRLTAEKVLRTWNLDAALVTLSGCQTALGRALGGEGTIGFAQAFISAGARSVLLSLWKVDDAATSLLMARFYEGLLARGLSSRDALIEAKRWLRRVGRAEAQGLLGGLESSGSLRGACEEPEADPELLPRGDPPFEHPFYWAAFVLFGVAE